MKLNPEPPGEAQPPMKNVGRREMSGKVVAGISLSCVLLVFLAWTLLRSFSPAKPGLLDTNGTWTVLNKSQPVGHVIRPSAFALDPAGQLHVADQETGGRIQKRDSNGRWTLLASAEPTSGGLKGLVQAMAFDTSGSLYVAEIERICKRDTKGNWTTLATKGQELGQVRRPGGLALDRDGNLYAADGKGRESQVLLRKADGQWTRLAADGDEVDEVNSPFAIAVDAGGNLYVANDTQTMKVQKRDAAGLWSLVEVDAKAVGRMGALSAMTVDASGALYLAGWSHDSPYNTRLLKRDAEGRWSDLSIEGLLAWPWGWVSAMSVDSSGALYVGEWRRNQRVQRRDPNGTWTVLCEAMNGPGFFVQPSHLALDSRGGLYVVDRFQRQVQKRDPDGRWSVAVDVSKRIIPLKNPSFPIGIDPTWPLPFWIPKFCLLHDAWPVAVDRRGDLYVADAPFSRVMALKTNGEWEICMPTGQAVGQTEYPTYVSVDALNNLYVIDGGERLQKRDSAGHWSILVSTNATAAGKGIYAVCAAPNGDVYVFGGINRKWGLQVLTSRGDWEMVAPQGSELGQVLGEVGIAKVGIATDAIGRLYVSDPGSHRLQVRDVDGKWSMLAADYSEGGPAGIAVDRQGAVYVNDAHKVFRWTPQPRTASDVSGKKK